MRASQNQLHLTLYTKLHRLRMPWFRHLCWRIRYGRLFAGVDHYPHGCVAVFVGVTRSVTFDLRDEMVLENAKAPTGLHGRRRLSHAP